DAGARSAGGVVDGKGRMGEWENGRGGALVGDDAFERDAGGVFAVELPADRVAGAVSGRLAPAESRRTDDARHVAARMDGGKHRGTAAGVSAYGALRAGGTLAGDRRRA